MIAMAMVLPWKIAKDFQSFVKYETLTLTLKICIFQKNRFGELALFLLKSYFLILHFLFSYIFGQDLRWQSAWGTIELLKNRWIARWERRSTDLFRAIGETWDSFCCFEGEFIFGEYLGKRSRPVENRNARLQHPHWKAVVHQWELRNNANSCSNRTAWRYATAIFQSGDFQIMLANWRIREWRNGKI
jgi:hypothetical protein